MILGFSAMELETATRYNLPIVVIIINNNGIFMGVDEISKNNAEIPVTALNPETAYEKLVDTRKILGRSLRRKRIPGDYT